MARVLFWLNFHENFIRKKHQIKCVGYHPTLVFIQLIIKLLY